jgi:hypothetical protein
MAREISRDNQRGKIDSNCHLESCFLALCICLSTEVGQATTWPALLCSFLASSHYHGYYIHEDFTAQVGESIVYEVGAVWSYAKSDRKV